MALHLKKENIMKDIPGYEGRYAVTPDGRVWSYEKITNVGKNGGGRVDGNKWLRSSKLKSNSGKIYHRVSLVDKDGKRKTWAVHRLVGLCYIPNPENLPMINHLNGITTDNRVENLEWCDAQRNSKHAYDNGWIKMPDQKGENNTQSFLTEKDIKLIREMARNNTRGIDISRKLGINDKTVYDIISKRRWKHVA